MAARPLAAIALALVAMAAGGCGGGGDDGDRRRAEETARLQASFRTASERTCQDAVQGTAVVLSRFTDRVGEAARTGDAVALRSQALRFLDDVERVMTPYLRRPDGAPPPEGADAWGEVTALAADRFSQALDASRTVVRTADVATPAGIEALQAELAAVGPHVREANAAADAIYRRHGVADCLSENLARVLAGRPA